MNNNTIFVQYDHRLVERAREFRNNPTVSEQLLWTRLKGKQMLGYDFHRQKPIKYFIVDFYCSSLRLAIEIDGKIHLDQMEADETRQNEIGLLGISFLRFTADEVEKNIESVCERIREWIQKNVTETM